MFHLSTTIEVAELDDPPSPEPVEEEPAAALVPDAGPAPMRGVFVDTPKPGSVKVEAVVVEVKVLVIAEVVVLWVVEVAVLVIVEVVVLSVVGAAGSWALL